MDDARDYPAIIDAPGTGLVLRQVGLDRLAKHHPTTKTKERDVMASVHRLDLFSQHTHAY